MPPPAAVAGPGAESSSAGKSPAHLVEPGEHGAPETSEVGGLRFALMTCYDLRFPDVARVLSDAGAHVGLAAAEWVRGPLKEHHWRTLVHARAIENTLYVAGADHPPPLGVGASLIVDPQGAFYFMEMNTRLQVEHPVTEAITGLDLVEWQLRVANGEPLPLEQDDLDIQGHAIEARISAENPDNNFLPATGTLYVYRKPVASSFEVDEVRIDDGVREGDAISPFYDPMIAKLIVHGDTREQALARLDDALAQTHIVGLATNVQFLRYVLASDAFAQAKLDTALIEREREVLFNQDKLGLELAVAAAVAQTVLTEQAQQSADPFSRTDGFHSHGAASRRIDLQYQGEPVVATLRYARDGLQLQVGTGDFQPLAATLNDDGSMDLRFGSLRERVFDYALGETEYLFTRRGATQITELDVLAHAGQSGNEGGRLTAPMPGKVVSFAVKAGDKVTKGQPLAVMEAMKMEHTVAAPADGEVVELLFAPGDQVTEGDELLSLKTA